jgi:hypothetical protein
MVRTYLRAKKSLIFLPFCHFLYFFCDLLFVCILNFSFPVTGKFLLSYIPRDKVRHEFVSVTPEGFRFRKHNMDSVGQLIKWFKV